MSQILTNIAEIVVPAAENYLASNVEVYRGNIGPQGVQGVAGQERYTWVKFATDETGVDLRSTPEGCDYLGIAVNQLVETPSEDGNDYVWALVKGADGDDGEQGIKGDKGDTGISVHHTKGTFTTDPEGDFSTSGELDTYTMYGDADETEVLGWFTVKNGDSAYSTAVKGGYVGTEESFQAELGSLGQLVIDVGDAVDTANAAAASVADKVAFGDITSNLTLEVEDQVLSALAGKTLKDQIDAVAAETETTVELDARDVVNRNVDNHTDGLVNGVYTLEERTFVGVGTELGTVAGTLPGAINEIKTEFDPIAYGVKLIGSNVLVSGCELSVNPGDNTRFDISAGVFYTVDNYTDASDPMYTMHTFAGIVGESANFIATGTTSYICFNAAGELAQLDTLPDRGENLRKYLMIGVVVHPSNIITGVSNSVNTTYVGLGATVAELGQAVGRITAGNIYGPNGTAMKLNKSAGMTFGVASNVKADSSNPNYSTDSEIVGVTFQYLYRDGAGDWTTQAGQTSVVASKYDDGSGTLADVVTSKWTIQKIYYASGSGSTVIEYGQKSYDNETLAIESIGIDSTDTSELTTNLIFRGWILVRGNCTNLSDSGTAMFLTANKFGDTSAISGGVGLTTVSLQQAYENSSEPEISTNTALGAVTFKEGTGTASATVLEVQNNLGSVVASIDGTGKYVGKVAVTPQGNLSSDTLQLALEELQEEIDTLTTTVEW